MEPRGDVTATYLFGKRFPNRLFVGGLPVHTTAIELAEFFGKISRVTETKIILDEDGISKGYGFVSFREKADIDAVKNMGTIFFKNKKLNLGPAVKKEGPSIQPEMVIVPNAPSRGQFYYPEHVPLSPQLYPQLQQQPQPPPQQPVYYYPYHQIPQNVYYPGGWEYQQAAQSQAYINPLSTGQIPYSYQVVGDSVQWFSEVPVTANPERRGSTDAIKTSKKRNNKRRSLPPRLRGNPQNRCS